MQRRDFARKVGAALTVGVTGAVAGCGGSSEPSTEQGPLVVQSHRGNMGEYGNVSVVGVAENVSNDTIAYGQIEAYFYDLSGARLGSGLDNINSLGAGRQWNFEAMYLGMDTEQVEEYKLETSP